MGHTLLRYAVVILAAALCRPCAGRDLRPSDHGLAFPEGPSSPPPDTHSFFGGSSSPELPGAKNISDTAWRSEGARDVRRDHVSVGLLLVSGVCGVTGAVLMVVSGVVFVFRQHKQRRMKAKAGGIGSTSPPISARPMEDSG